MAGFALGGRRWSCAWTGRSRRSPGGGQEPPAGLRTAFYLDGWVPVPEEEKLLRKLGEFTCCWETSDPAPEDYPWCLSSLRATPSPSR